MRYNLSIRRGMDVYEHASLDGAVGVLAAINDAGIGAAVGTAMFADLLDTGFVSRPTFTLTCEPANGYEQAVDDIVQVLADDPEWSMDTLDKVIAAIQPLRPDVHDRISERNTLLDEPPRFTLLMEWADPLPDEELRYLTKAEVDIALRSNGCHLSPAQLDTFWAYQTVELSNVHLTVRPTR